MIQNARSALQGSKFSLAIATPTLRSPNFPISDQAYGRGFGFPVAASASPGLHQELPETQQQLRIFDSGFENDVAELRAGDSKFSSAVTEFNNSDSVDHAVTASGDVVIARPCVRPI